MFGGTTVRLQVAPECQEKNETDTNCRAPCQCSGH